MSLVTAGMLLLLQTAPVVRVTTPVLAPAPFDVGERLEYKAKYSIFGACCAVLAVEGIDDVRGHRSWRFGFHSKLSFKGIYKTESQLTSWTGVDDFISRRFLKVIADKDPPVQDYRIHPDSGFFRRGADTGTKATPARPIDDVAFFYFVRRIPLEVGRTYRFDNYWRGSQNPVLVSVLKREELKLPDGTKVMCLLLHPVVDEKNGMFSAKSQARLWITDDARRIPVRIRSTYSFGDVTLNLERMTLVPGRG